MEALEGLLIVVVFVVLLRTLHRLYGQLQNLFFAGVAIAVGLLVAILFLPHLFVAVCMMAVAVFQILVDRRLCTPCTS